MIYTNIGKFRYTTKVFPPRIREDTGNEIVPWLDCSMMASFFSKIFFTPLLYLSYKKMYLVLDGQGGKGLQLKKNQTHFLKSNFNVLSKKVCRNWSFFVFPLLESFDIFLIVFHVGEKMTENT